MLERMKSLMNLDFSIWMQVDIESYILGLIAKWMRRFFKMNGSCFFLWYIVCISHKLQEIFTYNLYVFFKERKMYCMKKKTKKNRLWKWRTRIDFWDYWSNFFKHWKARTIFETKYFFNFLLEVPIRSNTLEPQYTVLLEQIKCRF